MSPRRMRLILAIAGVTIAALVIALVVALSQGDTAPPTPTATQPAAAPTTPPADGGSYITPQDIAVAAGDSLPCATFQPNLIPEDATTEITCDDGNVTIGIYTDYARRNIATDRAVLDKKVVLVGRNWTIAVEDPTLIAVAKIRLGGNVSTKGCPDECLPY